jgi:enediyne biosynthesis thioesterase
MRSYDYRHEVGFEETNIVGNVYFVNHVRWQGRCRELFLRDHAPGVLAELNDGLALVTTNCSCSYYAELHAFDVVTIRMRLQEMTEGRLTLDFEYWRTGPDDDELVARGEQRLACMRRENGLLSACPLPGS